MKIPFVHNTLVIFVAIGLIVISTAALSFYSYRYTVGRENLAETSLVQSNIRLVLNYVDQIEQRIIENDRVLIEMVDVDDSESWPAMDERIRNADLNVDQVYLLRPDSNYPIYPPYSFEIRNQWGGFRASFDVKELDVRAWAPVPVVGEKGPAPGVEGRGLVQGANQIPITVDQLFSPQLGQEIAGRGGIVTGALLDQAAFLGQPPV